MPPHRKKQFIIELSAGSRLLDVGCGNHAPSFAKSLNSSIHYTGIDIAPYEIDAADYAAADELSFVAAESFAESLRSWGPQYFDAAIASHVLEHVDDREGTIRALAFALRPGGRVYYAFPNERSTRFPTRGGTLNYYDDETHRGSPPSVDEVIAISAEEGVFIQERYDPYRPVMRRLVGLLQEPSSRLQNRVLAGTWALWGFETILVLSRPNVRP